MHTDEPTKPVQNKIIIIAIGNKLVRDRWASNAFDSTYPEKVDINAPNKMLGNQHCHRTCKTVGKAAFIGASGA